MEYIVYKVEAEEKVRDIAKKYNIKVEEIKKANPNVRFFKAIFGDEYVACLQNLKIPVIKATEGREYGRSITFKNKIKYRCEQVVTTRINGVPTSHMQTKRDYDFYKEQIDNEYLTKVSITDNVVNSFSEQYKQVLDMVTDLDRVKCNNIIIDTNKEGAMNNILNMRDIINNWKRYKSKLEDKYSNFFNPEGAKAVGNFIKLSEQQITNEKNLLEALKTDMFFFVLYNKYLVNHKDKLNDFSIPFTSQLFEGIKTNLKITQKVVKESSEEALIRKVSEMPKNIDENKIMKMYNKKYKPIVQYQFSKYKASYSEELLFNKKNNCIEESDITIIEEVQNNIEVLISFKLKKID